MLRIFLKFRHSQNLLIKFLHTDYVETAGINEFEEIRERLRDLMKYIPTGKMKYDH